jgi:hypothetical protein
MVEIRKRPLLQKNAMWLMKDVENSKIFRHQLNKAKNIIQIKAILADF